MKEVLFSTYMLVKVLREAAIAQVIKNKTIKKLRKTRVAEGIANKFLIRSYSFK